MLSAPALRTAGIVLLTVVTIEAGGAYVLRLVRGGTPATPFQVAFARAGHVTLGVGAADRVTAGGQAPGSVGSGRHSPIRAMRSLRTWRRIWACASRRRSSPVSVRSGGIWTGLPSSSIATKTR